MLKKIYGELVAIRKELQAIRGSLESKKFIPEDSSGTKYSGLSNSTGPFPANHLRNR